MKILHTFIVLTVSLALMTACGSNAPVAASPSETSIPATEVPETVAGPSSANEAEANPTLPPPTAAEVVQSEEQLVLSTFSQPVTATGELLVLYGHLLDASGAPLSGFAVEIWQVDANGIYDHPGDANTSSRDMGFQFYGTALTGENGLFAFRTIVPARYEPRPKHIHFKVKQAGHEILTSQFYFTGEVDAAQLGPAGQMLLLDLTNAQDAAGNAVQLAFKDLVVNAGTDGNLTITPSQTEGPYYPVTDLAAFDNDLANVG
jgi:protocatechuate 3,4-dioxygenase beta subunit